MAEASDWGPAAVILHLREALKEEAQDGSRPDSLAGILGGLRDRVWDILKGSKDLPRALPLEIPDLSTASGTWSAPVVLVRKEHQAWRVCVDY